LIKENIFFISNFRLVPNVVFFILGDSSASEFYMPSSKAPMKMEQTECSETSA